MKKNLIILVTVVLILIPEKVFSQGTSEDYQRADALSDRFSNKVYYGNVQPTWAGSSYKFSYENTTPDGKRYVLVDAVKLTKKEAFDRSKLASSMQKFSEDKIDPNNLPIRRVEFSEDITSFSFVWDDIEWTCSLPKYKLESGDRVRSGRWGRDNWSGFNSAEEEAEPVESPDGKMKAYILNHNLYIEDEKGDERQISYDGGMGKFYSPRIMWSPDSRKIMAYRLSPSEPHIIHYVESSPDDQIQPKHHSREYTKPGDALPQKFPAVYCLESGKHIEVPAEMITNQFGLNRFNWSKDSKILSFEYNKRGHQMYQVLAVDTESANTSVIIDERSETFIDYSGKRYRFDIEDDHKIIWASERDGWNHLYMYDPETGQVIRQITRGEWIVRDVIHIDTEKEEILFTASGKEEGDPYYIYYYRVNFDGSGLRKLTGATGNHSASFSPDYKYMIDTWSTLNTPPVTVLRRTLSGEKIMDLEEADISALLDEGWIAPEVFVSKARDGKTDIWGMIIKPTNFDPSKKYPVIEYIYAGPHSSFVPKSFRPYFGHIHPLAELGFIVVQLDGMGTSNRSKAFHDVCWKNLKDAGFPDRILWIKDAAAKYPYMDISGVGIYGTSAGGQSSTGALLFHPGFYTVGVSSCGCHDNRMDKIWWNEQWMGWPVGPEYAESSNVENAHKLKGKLLLINGEMDSNVDPSSTVQVVNALIKANKNFDYLFVPGMNHSSGGKYGERKRKDFFVKHLMGIDPPEWE